MRAWVLFAEVPPLCGLEHFLATRDDDGPSAGRLPLRLCLPQFPMVNEFGFAHSWAFLMAAIFTWMMRDSAKAHVIFSEMERVG